MGSFDKLPLQSHDVLIATDLMFDVLKQLNLDMRNSKRPFYAACSHGLYGWIFADLVRHDYVVERELSNRATQLGPETATRSVIESTTKKDGKTTEMVTKREVYTPLLEAQSGQLPAALRRNPRKLRRISPILPCMLATWKCDAATAHAFPELAAQVHRELGLPPDTLPASVVRNVQQNLEAELAPVTAFLGGQLAQDVVNVLGQREQPIQNLVVFDGENCAGDVFALHPDPDANSYASTDSAPKAGALANDATVLSD